MLSVNVDRSIRISFMRGPKPRASSSGRSGGGAGLLPFPAPPPERPEELARRQAWAMRELTVSKTIVLKSSNIFLRQVKAATGEEVSAEELGGADLHCK